jgi:hypothetical protein
VAGAIAIIASGTASAGGPLANCASGQPFLWGGGGANIPFNPDQGDLGPLTNAQAVAAVQESFDVWGAVPSSSVSYVDAGQLPVDVDISNFGPYLNAPAPDGLSAIVFDDTGEIFDLLFGPGSGVLGFAGPEWGNTLTCEIIEGLSFLNGPLFDDLTVAKDVMVHEFGHYTNLAHTVVNGQIYLGSVGGDTTGPTPNDSFGPPPSPFTDIIETMYPFYYGPAVDFWSPEADDIAILSTLYPEPDFFANTGTISGTIYAANGTTKLTGVNVIARNIADPFNDAVSAISSDFTEGFSQADPFTGRYTINGLTPGAEYAVFVDQILAGGFSTPPATLPGPEEFYNGADEANSNPPDDPSVFEAVPAAAGIPVTGIDIIFNQPVPGDPLPVGDDGFVELSLPFVYEVCGQSFDSVFVNANGNLTFGAPSSDFSESVPDMLGGPPRIAALWDDLSPFNLITGAQQGLVTFDYDKNSFTVIFEDVPEFLNTGANSFEIVLSRSSNHIDVHYGDMTAADGLAGVSCGGAITSGFETASDLSGFAPSRINLHNQPAVYEQFTPGSPNDLANSTVRYNGTTDYNDNWAEPNDTFRMARNISLPFDSIEVTRFTVIEPIGADVDYFRFAAQAGTTLVAEIVSGQLDSVLGLFQITGKGNKQEATLVAADDDGGAGLLSRIVFPITASGDYALAVSTFADFNFDGDGNSGGRYVIDLFTIDGFLIDLGDDDSEEVPLGFTFPYQGVDYTSVFVNSNGNLTFGSGDTDFTESVSDFLNDQPRIAPLWDDLSPNQGGLVTAEFGTGSMTVMFSGVPQFAAGDSNTFSVTLFESGDIDVSYGGVDALDGLVGVTDGGGAADPGETDLSTGGTYSAAGTTYEQFTGGADPFDLEGATLDFTP